jgi:FMN phosphatase YigB (HAD superfamily)
MSIDVGWRKPDSRFFAAALASGGASPTRCVIVGDSEANDIEPARALGMGTIRVAIDIRRPSTSAADHVCTSLDQVADLLADRPAGRAR